MSEVMERYGRIASGFGARLAGVRPDQWHSPTPCLDWDVRDLVVHVIQTQGRVVSTVTGSPPPDVAVEGDLGTQWAQAHRAVLASLDDPELASKVIGGAFGEQPFESLVSRLLCADTLFHTWDLSRATGQDEQLDEVAVARAMEFLEPIDEAIRRPGGFAPKITAPPGADAQTELLAFGGRAVG